MNDFDKLSGNLCEIHEVIAETALKMWKKFIFFLYCVYTCFVQCPMRLSNDTQTTSSFFIAIETCNLLNIINKNMVFHWFFCVQMMLLNFWEFMIDYIHHPYDWCTLTTKTIFLVRLCWTHHHFNAINGLIFFLFFVYSLF